MHLSIYALRRSICASLHYALDIPIRSCPNRIDMRPFGARNGICPKNPNFTTVSRHASPNTRVSPPSKRYRLTSEA